MPYLIIILNFCMMNYCLPRIIRASCSFSDRTVLHICHTDQDGGIRTRNWQWSGLSIGIYIYVEISGRAAAHINYGTRKSGRRRRREVEGASGRADERESWNGDGFYIGQCSSRMAQCTMGQDKIEERRDCGAKAERGRGSRKGKAFRIVLYRWQL